MRFLALVVALVALCMSSMQVDAALNVADLDSTLVSVAKATAKSIPRANSELVKLLTAYEKSPSRSTASFLDTQGENVAAKTAALAEKLNAAITAVSDVLGIVAPDEDFDEAKKGVVRASVACPRALTVLGHLIDAVPFAALTKDDGGQLLRAVHLLGYTVTHTLNDYSCRAHINLLEFVQKTDRALTRYVDSIDTATSDVALDATAVWSDLREHLVTYLTTVYDQTAGSAAAGAVNGLNPAEEQASLDMFQAAAMADMLADRTPLAPADAALAERLARVAAPSLKDEL